MICVPSLILWRVNRAEIVWARQQGSYFENVVPFCFDFYNTNSWGNLCSPELFEELTVEDYEELNRVNYLGVIYTVKAGYASMKRG